MSNAKSTKKCQSLNGFRIGNIRRLIEEEFPGFLILKQRTNHEKRQFEFFIADADEKGNPINEEEIKAFMKKRVGVFLKSISIKDFESH